MTQYLPDVTASKLTLWTYREGLLSRVAHDLSIQATEFLAPLTVEGDRVRVDVRVNVRDLKVQGQVKDGEVRPLSDSDHAEIEKNLTTKVLDASRHPELSYRGEGRREGDRARLQGELTLRGTSRPLALEGTLEDDEQGFRITGAVRFRQTDWGIKPYSALMGALKVKDELRVSWDLRYPSV